MSLFKDVVMPYYSPVNGGLKMANRKKNRVVLKIGRIVEGNALNNILKVPAGRR